MYIEEKIIEPLQESINTVRREHLKFSKVPEFEGNILGEEVKVMRTVKSPQTFVWPGGDTNFHFPARIQMSIKSETLQSLVFFYFST